MGNKKNRSDLSELKKLSIEVKKLDLRLTNVEKYLGEYCVKLETLFTSIGIKIEAMVAENEKEKEVKLIL